MNINRGDFIICNQSVKPGLVISNHPEQESVLVSIIEFNGDYTFQYYDQIDLINPSSEEKLSLLGSFGKWFYNEHSDIFIEIILENLYNYFVFNKK